VAAASLAQVHRGRLRDGRDVAVKVLYPGIEDEVRRDLGLVRFMLPLVLRARRGLEIESVVDEIARTVPGELDLTVEARNAERVGAVLRHRGDVVVPGIVWEWTTRRVLVMDYVDGIKITDRRALRAAGIDPNAVAEIVVDAYCEQVLEAGFFQADPHPGNLLVLPGPRLAQLFLGTTSSERGYADFRLVAQADHRLQAATAANALTVPGDVTLVARVMGTLSGIGRQLDSRVNVSLSMLLHA